MIWYTMDTAPRDGTQILVTCGKIVEVACWAPDVLGPEYPWVFASDNSCYAKEYDTWTTELNGYPDDALTHWAPIPVPPEMIQ